jgi:dynein heavy chain
VVSQLLINECSWRDIIKHLVDQDVKKISSFEWESQFRTFYYDDIVKVSMGQFKLAYGYEYIGAP